MSTKSHKTREKIISSTLSLLNSSQLSKINMEDIAINTGISRQACLLMPVLIAISSMLILLSWDELSKLKVEDMIFSLVLCDLVDIV